MERGLKWLRARVTDRRVFYVAGNHESYGTEIAREVNVLNQDKAAWHGQRPILARRPRRLVDAILRDQSDACA